MGIRERSAARRRRIRVNTARGFAAAEEWDLDFWQSVTPEERLSALVAIRRDVEKAQRARAEQQDRPPPGSDPDPAESVADQPAGTRRNGRRAWRP